MDPGPLSMGIGVALVVYILIVVGVAALGLWLLYTIIWRAVRRGMREFSADSSSWSATSTRRSPGPRDW